METHQVVDHLVLNWLCSVYCIYIYMYSVSAYTLRVCTPNIGTRAAAYGERTGPCERQRARPPAGYWTDDDDGGANTGSLTHVTAIVRYRKPHAQGHSHRRALPTHSGNLLQSPARDVVIQGHLPTTARRGCTGAFIEPTE